MIRRHLTCACGNRDDEDVDSMSVKLPPCSAECGHQMAVEAIEDLDDFNGRRGVRRQPEPEDYAEDYRYDERA